MGYKNWPISRTGYHFECNFFKNGFQIWKLGQHIPTKIIAKYPHPLGVLHPMGPLIKTLRWDDLRDGGDASKIIFLRVLSGHLSTTRFDQLSRFLNHNYETDFLETHNQFAYIIRDLWPVTRDLWPATCGLDPSNFIWVHYRNIWVFILFMFIHDSSSENGRKPTASAPALSVNFISNFWLL